MLLSICIPNFNRSKSLNNCLNSICIAKKNSNIAFEVCISDNCSTDNVEEIVQVYKKHLNVKFKKNHKNLGLGKNILSAVSMAQGEFVWILGNDDLIVSQSLNKLASLINENKNLDFFFINSFHLSSKYVFNSSQPFNTYKLPANMDKVSKIKKSYQLNFFDLIDPKISFDFLMGIFLSVFRRKNWKENLNVINIEDINKKNMYSTFDNTCPHVKIFSKAFSKSKAYFMSEPLSVNLHGEREWGDLYNFVESIRVPETLNFYHKNGMSKIRYFYCKNYSLKNFIPSIIKIILLGRKGGLNYISIRSNILSNLFFPNLYFSPINFILTKFLKVFN